MNLGLRFKRFRERKGLSQKEAAELIGINGYQLANYETNRSEPSIDILKRMSRAYGTTIDNLVANFYKQEAYKEENGLPYEEVGKHLFEMLEELKKEYK